jgi:hypothetical protein
MEKAIKAHPKFKEFAVINVAGDNVNRIGEVKVQIKRSQGRTITISCGRFNTGSTVKEWDSVFMLNDTKSAELYFQTVFRPGTPWKEGNKRVIYCFDYNYNRVLEVIGKYCTVLSFHSDKTPSGLIRDFLDTAPVHCFTDEGFVPVRFEDVSSLFINSSKKHGLGSELLFDDSKINLEVIRILGDQEETNNFSISKKITEDPEGSGKNFMQSGGKKPEINKNKIKNLKSCARTLTLKIAGIMYIRQGEVNCVDDLYNFPEDFSLMTGGETIRNFDVLINSGFINKELLDDAMTAYSLELDLTS